MYILEGENFIDGSSLNKIIPESLIKMPIVINNMYLQQENTVISIFYTY